MKFVKENKYGGCFLVSENDDSTTIIYISRCEDFPDEYWYWIFDVENEVIDEFLQSVLDDDSYSTVGVSGASYSSIKEVLEEVIEDGSIECGSVISEVYEHFGESMLKDFSKTINVPFMPGDTVWCTTSDQSDWVLEPIECVVEDISIADRRGTLEFVINSKAKSDGWGVLGVPDLLIPNHMNVRHTKDVGVNVFLDYADAEKVLKNNKEENGGE